MRFTNKAQSLANKARQNLQKKQPIVETGFTRARDQLVNPQQGMSYYVLDAIINNPISVAAALVAFALIAMLGSLVQN